MVYTVDDVTIREHHRISFVSDPKKTLRRRWNKKKCKLDPGDDNRGNFGMGDIVEI